MQFSPEPPENVTLKPRYGLTAGLTADFALNRLVGLSVSVGAGLAMGSGIRYSLDLLYTLGLRDALRGRRIRRSTAAQRW